jgi:hypothetical protein
MLFSLLAQVLSSCRSAEDLLQDKKNPYHKSGLAKPKVLRLAQQ